MKGKKQIIGLIKRNTFNLEDDIELGRISRNDDIKIKRTLNFKKLDHDSISRLVKDLY